MTRTATDTSVNLVARVGSAAVWFQITDPADPADVERVLTAYRASRPPRGGCRIVAVDGPSGSGKTTLGVALARAIGCPVLHMDEFFPGWDGLDEAPGLLTDQVLKPFAAGTPATYRRWDWERCRWGETVVLPVPEALVVEGCGASVGPAGAYAAVRVWVEAPRALRMARGLARDGESYAPHWQRWADQEDRVFAADRTRDRADVFVDTSRWD